MTAIDINAFAGPWPYWSTKYDSPQAILELMERHGIGAAAIVHTRAIFSDWKKGNDEALDLATREKRFIPFASINPADGPTEVTRSLETYHRVGVKGIRLYPQHHHYSLASDSVAQHLLSAIGTLGFPVVLPVRVILQWGLPVMDLVAIETVVGRYPHIRFVISGTNYGETRLLFDLMRKYPNTMTEISGMQAFRAVAEAVSYVGHGRILFGAGIPIMYPACSVAKLAVSNLNSGERKAVESGNALRLLGI